jgi:hypothetical protein
MGQEERSFPLQNIFPPHVYINSIFSATTATQLKDKHNS